MKIIVKNLATEYKDDGEGKAVLFLHGWQDNLHSFDALVPLLPGFRIIRLDLPGFGGTETPRETWDLKNYVDFVAGFIDKLGTGIYAVVGHSFGGRIAIKGAAENSFGAEKLVLMDSAGIAKGRTPRNMIIKIAAKIIGAIMYIPPLIFWREKLKKKAYDFIGSDYLGAGVLKKTFVKIIGEDLSETAGKIKIPTLLIWGEKDAETPVSDGVKFSYIIGGSRLEIIKGTGHFAHKEKPSETAKLIREFL